MLEHLHDNILQTRSVPLCTVGKFIESLNDTDTARMEDLLADDTILASEIARALQPHVKLASNTVARHRRRANGTGCGCPR